VLTVEIGKLRLEIANNDWIYEDKYVQVNPPELRDFKSRDHSG
jgi:hypothetical protein